MADILVTSPFQPFTLPTQFKAVFNGYIYCGTVDAVDPSVSQVQVYLVNESGDRVPVAQPLRTNAGGFLVYNGQPAKFVTDSNHSLLVRDSLGNQLWYAPDVSIVDPDTAYQIIGTQAREALRRSYAEAGYNLVDGSFEVGGTLTYASDVLLHGTSGKAYSGPAGIVAAGTDPLSGGFVDRSGELLRLQLAATDGAEKVTHLARTVGDNLDDIPHATNYATVAAAISASPDKGTLLIPAGEYGEAISTNKCDLVGVGYASILNNNTNPIKVLRSTPDWERRRIQNMRLQGNDSADSYGVLYDPTDVYAGRWNVSYLGIANYDMGVYKPQGNIGNVYENINYRNCNYGHKAKSGSLGTMHSGADTWRDCYFQGIRKWCVDIFNSTDGGGGVSIQDSIMEQCAGGGIRIEFGNIVPYTPITIRNVWFELIATAATVNRDGVNEVPRQIKAVNAPMVIAEDCYLTNIELVNSTLLAKRCRIDNASNNIFSLNSDATSCFMVDDLIAKGGVGSVPTIRSVATQKGVSGVGNLSLRGMPVRNKVPSTGVKNGTALAFNPYTGIVGTTTWTFTGTTNVNATCVADGTLDAQCSEITVPTGNTNQSQENASVTSGKWYVWGVDAKLLSGSPAVRLASTHTLGDVYLSQNTWISTFGIAKAGSSGVARLYIQGGATPATIRFANYFIVQFDSEVHALEFCNARIAVK